MIINVYKNYYGIRQTDIQGVMSCMKCSTRKKVLINITHKGDKPFGIQCRKCKANFLIDTSGAIGRYTIDFKKGFPQ